MEIRLHQLDTFAAQGSDGKTYKVGAYERLVLAPGNTEQWEPSGVAEYRLDDGRPVQVDQDGTMRIAASEIMLHERER
jgi:hypothetical protein